LTGFSSGIAMADCCAAAQPSTSGALAAKNKMKKKPAVERA